VGARRRKKGRQRTAKKFLVRKRIELLFGRSSGEGELKQEELLAGS
jgi:hypothetical protein